MVVAVVVAADDVVVDAAAVDSDVAVVAAFVEAVDMVDS